MNLYELYIKKKKEKNLDEINSIKLRKEYFLKYRLKDFYKNIQKRIEDKRLEAMTLDRFLYEDLKLFDFEIIISSLGEKYFIFSKNNLKKLEKLMNDNNMEVQADEC